MTNESKLAPATPPLEAQPQGTPAGSTGEGAELAPLTDAEIEALAVEHESFGFGRVDEKGYTCHGFNPDGLAAFVAALRARLAAPVAVEQADATHGLMTEAPRLMTPYWVVQFGIVGTRRWANSGMEQRWLAAGLCYSTEADARAALQATKEGDK